jgi:hypothetical protein
VQGDFSPGSRNNLRDSTAHLAGTDDKDMANRHGA